jgi:CHAT domain-containing protein
MRKTVLIFLLTQWAFSQSPATNVEQKIYTSIDEFVANPSEKAVVKLELREKSFNAKSKPELLALVILNCNKAYYQNLFGQTQKAIKNYEKAWQIFQENKLSDYDITESCLKPLGNLYTIIGDYDNAENVIKQYYFIANTEKNQSAKFAAILNLSSVYYTSGKNLEAIKLLEKTIDSENLSKTQKGSLWNNLGNNYLALGNNTKAKLCYQTSIDLLKSTDVKSKSLANAYRNAALLNNDLEAFLMQKEFFLRQKDNSIRAIGKFYYDEAFLYYQNNKLTEAQQAIQNVFKILIPNYSKKGLPNKDALYAETTLLDALDLQAGIFSTQDQPKKALESYALSFHIEALFQSVLVYENSKIITQIRNRNRTEKCIEIYNSLYRKEQNSTYPESAFLLSEQTKSAVLKQALADSKTNSRTEKLILAQLQNWNTVIVKEQQKLESANIAKINRAIQKQNELMLLLKTERDKTSKIVGTELRIEDLYAQLARDKAILVEYFMGVNHMYVFTVNGGKTKMESVSNDIASPKLLKFLDFFSDAKTIADNPSQYNHFANVAYKTVMLPKKSSAKNLIIIPDGILAFFPFEALITEESKASNFAKMHYLLNDFKIGYSNSADFYLNAMPFEHQKNTVLGVFPIFQGTNLELAFSKKELKNLRDNFEGKFLDRQKATFENFKANAANYSILHLSTHASSGDILESASIKFYDQEVLYSEFYNLDLHPDLVVLSACETGIGKLYKAEGAMSIARGFQFAGAQNLLFSLWKVNDFTTSVLMGKFYANVKNGSSYFDSNHRAKLDFLADESIPNAKKSPYYWSAFVYYGSLENASKPNYFLWISLLGGLIALLLLWKIFFRKK